LFLTTYTGNSGSRVDYLNGSEFQLNSGSQNAGKLTHVVWVYDPDNYITKMYQNGVLVAEQAVPNNPLSSLHDVNNWIGRSQWNDPMFQGKIYDLRIYTGIMTASEVAARYAQVSSGVGPTESPTVSSSVAGGSLVLSWADGFMYNVLTNNDLTNTNGWGVMTSGSSPITNAIGSEPQLFYKLHY
jgi:hypothetical protein